MISLFHRLPLGGKLLAKQGDEGQPNNIQAFFSKSRFTATRVLGFPVGEAVGFRRLKRSLQAVPLPEKNSANFIFSAKIVSPFVLSPFLHALPLPKHSRPYSFFVVISRLSSLRLFPSASIPVFPPTRSFQKPFLLAILSLRIVVFAGSTIIIS